MNNPSKRPPVFGMWLLKRVIVTRNYDYAVGDLAEIYHNTFHNSGRVYAYCWFWFQVVTSLPRFLNNTFYWSLIMIKSYMLIALRNLRKQKTYSLINLIGLAAGMAGFMLFALSAGVKLNAEKFHENADRIYGVIQEFQSENRAERHLGYIPAPLLPVLKEEFPEIEDAVRVLPTGKVTMKYNDDSFYQNNVLYVDPGFLTVFTFDLVSGVPETALSEPYSIVLSETTAKKYFGDTEPLGKTLLLEKEIEVTVTGITKDIKRTSSMRFECLISMETMRSFPNDLDDWTANRYAAFTLLRDNADQDNLSEKISTFITGRMEDMNEPPQRAYLFPLLDFRMHGDHITTFLSNSPASSTYILISIGLLLLIIVCVNFINLSIARHMFRTKEICMRKVIGAGRAQLVRQFLGESLLLAFMAIPLAILIYEIIHPIFWRYFFSFGGLGIVAEISNSVWNYPFLLHYLIIAALITGTISGLYPAFFVTAFKPLQLLQGSLQQGRKKHRGRKLMIILQFSLSLIFIVAASILKDQFGNIINADLGFSRENIAVLQISGEKQPTIDLLKTEFPRIAGVERITTSVNLPSVWVNSESAALPESGEGNEVNIEAYGVDYDFFETLEMKMKSGRSFQKNEADDNNFIINESAAELFQLDDPVGRELIVGEKTGTIIGVAENYLFGDIGFDIPPAVLHIDKENANFMLVKYASSVNFSDLRGQFSEQWQVIAPETPFECYTLDDYFNDFFKLVMSVAGFLNAIGVAAIFFSCLGLLGLASYMVNRRTKEIGIRKALGATLPGVLWTLTKEFFVLVVIANVIVLPLVWYGWTRVLEFGLLFVTDIGAGTYIFALLISIFSAMLAVISQVWNTARANPVDSLRYE
ncbi:ABC transporter permease [candidate division KSB1 bacterium]